CLQKIRRQIEDLEKVSGILSSSLTVDGVSVDTYLTNVGIQTRSKLCSDGCNIVEFIILGDSQSLLIVDGIHVKMVKIDDDLKESEIMCNNASHPVRGTRRQGGEIGFIYEAKVEKWSSLDFSFALTTPSLHDHDQRDMFCFYLFSGINKNTKTPSLHDHDQRDMFCFYLFSGINKNTKRELNDRQIVLHDIDPLQKKSRAPRGSAQDVRLLYATRLCILDAIVVAHQIVADQKNKKSRSKTDRPYAKTITNGLVKLVVDAKNVQSCVPQFGSITMDEISPLHEKSNRRFEVSPGSSSVINVDNSTYVTAKIRATFYPKFENEKSDQEVRNRMIELVSKGLVVLEVRNRMIELVSKGLAVLEISLKQSGSLFMYAGHEGGAYAKNSYGNVYTAVGVFVLGRVFREAWGTEASKKQAEFNEFLEREHMSISMELMTADLGDHGQRPSEDYGTATSVCKVLDEVADISVPVHQDLGLGLPEISAAYRSDDEQTKLNRIKALLQNTGTSFYPDYVDWFDVEDADVLPRAANNAQWLTNLYKRALMSI
nr:tRNA ligase 1 isoform X1 [Tanacetum cinerariifolium]